MAALWKGLHLRAHSCMVLLCTLLTLATGAPGVVSANERSAVLAVNGEFYRAFREGDVKAMNKVWGRQGAIAVEHPSGWRLEGRREVMHSWVAIMRQPPNITCKVQGVSFASEKATVYCDELLNSGSVRMKNVFHRENGAWKMIYHGPVPKDEAVS